MIQLTFKKEIDEWFGTRWYVELPSYEGPKSDLEMVTGADTMLEYMAEGEMSVDVVISEDEFQGGDKLVLVKTDENGGDYKMSTYRGIEINLDLWLCNVTLFVLGKFPEVIWIAKI